MPNVIVEPRGEVALVRLAGGVTNAIGYELATDLANALSEVKSRFKGLVLAGGDKFFSIGLNLPELLELDRKGLADFWNLFDDMVLGLYTLPLPTACAITGHAPAAGAILALACDFRFAAAGKKRIGLNEIQIGVPVPYLADRMLRQVVGNRVANELEYAGKLIESEEAKSVGLIDAIAPVEEVEPRAVAQISELAAMPAAAFILTKQHRTREIPSKFQAIRQELNHAFMDCWFAPATQALLKEASAKF
jgi:enoyl-CoA hydratase/carnithine racemase